MPRAGRRSRISTRSPATSSRRVAAGGAEDARRAIEAATAAFDDAWCGSRRPPSASASSSRPPTCSSRAATRSSSCSRARPAAASASGCSRCSFVPGLFRQAAAIAVRAGRPGHPLRRSGHVRDGTAPARRRRRRDRAVERRADPFRALDRRAARARQHRRPQAVGVVAGVGRPDLGRDLRRGRAAGRRAEHRHARAGRGRRRSATSSSRIRRCGGINFTGSTDTGRKLAEAAGRNLKRIVLELGGYNPLIVLADADLEYAVNASAFGAFLHQGQICMSARKIIVERPIADEFVERLAEKTKTLKAGDPKEHDTIIGPLINPRRAGDGEGARRRRGREGRARARGRRGRRAVLPGDAARRRSGGLRPRAGRDVRAGRGDRGGRQRRRGGRARERDDVRARVRGSSRATPTAASRSRSRSRRGSSTSTTSRSATSRRCRSAASRTPAGGASAGRR